MKPLSIKEQIEVLEELLQNWDICGMCCILRNKMLKKYGIQSYEYVSDYIPSFTHYQYLAFYPRVISIQIRSIRTNSYWDSRTIFGNIRRRWFIRHLIKKLKKQL